MLYYLYSQEVKKHSEDVSWCIQSSVRWSDVVELNPDAAVSVGGSAAFKTSAAQNIQTPCHHIIIVYTPMTI